VINAASNALSLMLFLLVPWTAVNLTDYFFVRRGEYAITDLFDPRGVYGGWSWRGIAAYFLGFAAMVPFAVLPFFTGVFGGWLGGIDVSWLAGLVVAASTYFLFTRGLNRTAERIAVSRASLSLTAVEQEALPPEHRPPLEHGLLEGP
jgi:NCS1 family nucleobase:cation symporter-1